MEPAIIYRFRSSLEFTHERITTLSTLLNEAFRARGVTMYAESFKGGAVFFFATWADFVKYCDIYDQFGRWAKETGQQELYHHIPEGQSFEVRVELVKFPPNCQEGEFVTRIFQIGEIFHTGLEVVSRALPNLIIRATGFLTNKAYVQILEGWE